MNSYHRPYERYVVLDPFETSSPGTFFKKRSEFPIVVPCTFRVILNSRVPEWNCSYRCRESLELPEAKHFHILQQIHFWTL
jgi:hypothetical protein